MKNIDKHLNDYGFAKLKLNRQMTRVTSITPNDISPGHFAFYLYNHLSFTTSSSFYLLLRQC